MNQGCGMQYQQKGNWVIKGIDIPINTPLFGPIKIANVEYTGPDYTKISDTLRILETSRLGYCSLTTATNFSQLSPTVKDQIFLGAMASFQAMERFATKLVSATTPAEGLKAQTEATTDAKNLPIPPVPLPTVNVTSIDLDARFAAADVAAAVLTLRSQVAQLSQDLVEVRRTGAQRMKVTGFEPSGAALVADQRSTVLADFRKAIAAVPVGRTPTVLLIGYADGAGFQANNTDLALRRATNVAEFLRRHEFGRDFHTEVTTGSVANQVGGEHARRVDIVVSHLALGLQSA
ncbi:hypothetical protein os1_02690 [Comamonadaceae bacterium OS-1]|nr:hypothetical protein os1_02690 [Comamonadaceae bacterium OS-1]